MKSHVMNIEKVMFDGLWLNQIETSILRSI